MKIFDAMYAKKDTKTQFRGAQFIVPTKDISLAPSVMSGAFEHHELDLFEVACRNAATVIDVGANIGIYTVLAAKVIGRGAKVYAFEPVSENIGLLRKNIELNKVSDRVEVQAVAVGERNGNLEIFLSDRQVGTHSAAQKNSSGKSVKVPMQSVDAFITKNKIKRIDVIKVDVEGYDGQVLLGALETLRRHKPIMFIEYSPDLLRACGQDPGDFIASLADIYKYCVLVDEFKGRVEIANPSDLGKAKIATNVNLVFTEDVDRFRALMNDNK